MADYSKFKNANGDDLVLQDSRVDDINPVPDTDNANDGDVLTYDGNTDEIVWATPQSGGSDLPSYTQSDAGKVHAVNQNGNGVEWINAGGSIELPALPTTNGTGGGLNETMTRVILIGDCNYDDHFTLKWEYDFNVIP